MAATGYTPIYLYYSSTTSNTPSAGNLGYGELAINITDKNLFFKDNTNAVNTVPIRQASGSSNGWLSSTDWTTFNNKGSGTVTSVAALTLGTTGTDLSSTVANGTTTPVITLNVPTASASNRGALSSTDWSTFNGKQAALVSGTNIKTVNGTTLLGSGDVGTINVAYGGTGLTSLTANYIPYGNGTNAFNSSSSFTYNGTTFTTNSIYSQTYYTASDWISAWSNNGTSGHSMNFGYNNNSSTTYGLYISGGRGASGQLDLAVASKFYVFGSGGVSIGNSTDGGAGNLRFADSSHGIYFGASSLLSDYEDGTWTPEVTFGGGSTGITYATQVGKYKKVGSMVTVQATVQLSNKGSSTGSLAISLPFTTPSGYRGGLAVGNTQSITSTNAARELMIEGNTSSLYIRYPSGTGGTTQLTDADVANGFYIVFGGSYVTS